MAFLLGTLSQYFQPSEEARTVAGVDLQRELGKATRDLVRGYFSNTAFARGFLDLTFVRHVPSHTIFSRRDRGRVPYLLADLANDLRSGSVSRLTINEATETVIRSLVRTAVSMPVTPPVVIVEDSSAQHYLILEGNKRLTAVLLADSTATPARLEAYVGHSALDWSQMCRLHSMEPPA